MTFYAKKGGFNEVGRSHVANFQSDGGGVAMLRPKYGAAKISSNQNISMSVPTASKATGQSQVTNKAQDRRF